MKQELQDIAFKIFNVLLSQFIYIVTMESILRSENSMADYI